MVPLTFVKDKVGPLDSFHSTLPWDVPTSTYPSVQGGLSLRHLWGAYKINGRTKNGYLGLFHPFFSGVINLYL